MGTQPMQVQIGVLPGGMKPEELLVQLVAGPGDGNGFTDTPDVVDMARTEESTADRLVYAWRLQPVPERAACVRRASASRHTGAGLGRWRRGWSCGDKPDIFGTGLWKGYFGTPLSSAGALNAPGVVYATGAR